MLLKKLVPRAARKALRPYLPVRYRVQRLDGYDYNDDPNIERLLFICGLHRSGTTLLERLLTACFELSFLRMSVMESEGQLAQSVYSPASRFGGPGRFAFHAGMADELARLTDYAKCRERILADWRRYVVGDYRTLIEKSPPNLTKIWWLRKVFVGARFIILTRDPRAASAATQKWSNSSIEDLMAHWHKAYSAALRDFDDKDTMIVRYEDICADHQAVLRAIGAFIDVPMIDERRPLDERFQKFDNSNERYLKDMPPKDFGEGVWSRFGYDLTDR